MGTASVSIYFAPQIHSYPKLEPNIDIGGQGGEAMSQEHRVSIYFAHTGTPSKRDALCPTLNQVGVAKL